MNVKLMMCKTCGKEIAKNAKICPHCGSKNKKPIYKKWWFWLFLLIIFIIIAVSSGEEVSETGTSTPVNNSSNISSNSNTTSTESKNSSVVDTYKLIAENSETNIKISEDAIKFMMDHENFFPGNEKISGTISDSVNFDIGYAHLSKNLSKYDDKLICVYGTVVDIEESEDASLTYVHIMDYDGNSYVLYYLGTLEDIFEDTEVSAYALPFSMITFENLSGAYTEAVAGAGCLFNAG